MLALDMTLDMYLLPTTLWAERTLEHWFLTTLIALVASKVLFLAIDLAAMCAPMGSLTGTPTQSNTQL